MHSDGAAYLCSPIVIVKYCCGGSLLTGEEIAFPLRESLNCLSIRDRTEI
jgi:hypothetical protein